MAVENETGLCVSHLMVSFPGGENRNNSIEELAKCLDKYRDENTQIIFASTFGAESDAMIMILAQTSDQVLEIENSIKSIDLMIVESFLSLTETSEYTTSEIEERARIAAEGKSEDEIEKSMAIWNERMEHYRQNKLFPKLPPKDMEYLCFYPMSKKREESANWYLLDFDTRAKYMRAHGAVGRKYAGRIVQLITGATGLTDYEWGVSLFSPNIENIKEIVYEMRFDEASALFAEFGHFTIGKICDPLEVRPSF